MKKILIVDDIAENRALLVALVSHLGHQALEASDGVEALSRVRAERPQLVISDILMPTMDGYEFVRRLRLDPAIAATEVIFYTAYYHEREARNLALACGVSHVMVKPCEPEEILRVIGLALVHQPAAELAAIVPEFDREHLHLMTGKLSEKIGELENVNRRLGALTELNLQLASERDPRTLLEKVCRGARDLLGAKYAFLGARDKNGGATVILTSGIDPELLGAAQAPRLDEGLLGQARAERRSFRITSRDDDARNLGLPPGYPFPESAVAAPVVSLSASYGWLCLIDKLGSREFSDEDERILTTLAGQVGRIYENGSLYLQVQSYAAELEAEIAEREKAAQLLRESQQRLDGLVTSAMDGIVSVDADKRIVNLNSAAEKMFGYAQAELLGQPLDQLMPERHRAAHPVQMAAFGESGTTTRAMGALRTVSGMRKSGEEFLVEAAISKHESAGRRFYTAILRDVTERARAEALIRRLNRVYAVLSGINSLIVRVKSRDELFREACRIAVEVGRFPLAWLGIVDRNAHEIRIIASYDTTQGFVDLLPLGLSEAAPGGLSLSGQVVFGGKPVIVNDIEASALPLKQDALERGFRSMVALPLTDAAGVMGVLSLHADTANFFDQDEMKLLLELAGDISFAIDHLEKEERIDYLAYYDVLTGLANRSLFLERLTQQIRDAIVQGRRLAVLVLDIERFRLVNDTLGRGAGDRLLQLVAARFPPGAAERAHFARTGADQFTIIVPEAESEEGLVRRVEAKLEEYFGPHFSLGATELKVEVRMGVALCPNDGDDAEVLLTNAESAVKKAKLSGDRYLFYTQEMTERVAGRLTLESQLRQALEREEFVLYYQPKVQLATRRIESLEALIRWNSPELGLVPPIQFIPLMEQTGLILEVGAWALRRAVQDHQAMLKLGTALRIAVNVSPLQLRRRNFVEMVAEAVQAGKTPPGIDLEITESLMMEDVEGNIEKLIAVRALGVDVMIDDFGTGYSSLGYLARLPAVALKIDRSFINSMLEDPNNMTLVSTIITLAHSLNLKVIAEGVETVDQEKMLALLRCDEIQGYLVSRALPLEDMLAFTRQWGERGAQPSR